MEIVPEEAETVRLIYRLFMQGQTPYAIVMNSRKNAKPKAFKFLHPLMKRKL